MTKLIDLQEWVTLERAAEYIAGLLREPVLPADVLRLGLEERLTLSVYFPLETPFFWSTGSFEDPDAKMREENLAGVFDLPMLGDERLEVEKAIQRLTDGPELEANSASGIFLTRDECLHQLLCDDDPEHDWSADRFPDYAQFVVRTQAIKRFAKSLKTDPDKPLTTRERRTVLVIIAALCDELKIKTSEHGAAAAITRITEASGYPISADVVEGLIKKIRDARESRT